MPVELVMEMVYSSSPKVVGRLYCSATKIRFTPSSSRARAMSP